MSRRLLLFLPAVLAAVALPVAPAMAGEDDPVPPPAPPVVAPAPPAATPAPVGFASLRAKQGCVTGARAKATVKGELIDSVAFYVDGDLVKTADEAGSGGGYSMSMSCTRLDVGANRARAVVTFARGASPSTETLRFQITRTRRATARFAG